MQVGLQFRRLGDDDRQERESAQGCRTASRILFCRPVCTQPSSDREPVRKHAPDHGGSAGEGLEGHAPRMQLDGVMLLRRPQLRAGVDEGGGHLADLASTWVRHIKYVETLAPG